MNAIKNITIGHTERLYKPVGYTMLANLVNIIPFLPLHRGGAHHLRRVRRQRTTARHGKAVVHLRHIGRLYAGDGSGRTGLLPGQFQRSLRNERIGAYRTGGTSAETLSRISFPARPRRSFVHARYRFHDGRDGHFPPFAPTDGSRRHARAGIPLAGMDRLADGRCHVRRTAGRLACPMDEHECAEKLSGRQIQAKSMPGTAWRNTCRAFA